MQRWGIKAKDVVTKEAVLKMQSWFMQQFQVQLMLLLHIPAIAHEFGIEIDSDTFDRMHRGAHYLLDIRPAGKWPAQYLLLCRWCAKNNGRD